ncbi:MAG TPA: hypothetical protein VN175_06070 [Rhizomicrobium sp.]|nr:hypothetical protein [Rhizomicrobium sp.]
MLETEEVSEHDLPPEIVRRLQVEELWARRLVLADLMNAERLKLFYQRRADIPFAEFPPADPVWKEPPPPKPGASIVPITGRKSLMPGG